MYHVSMIYYLIYYVNPKQCWGHLSYSQRNYYQYMCHGLSSIHVWNWIYQLNFPRIVRVSPINFPVIVGVSRVNPIVIRPDRAYLWHNLHFERANKVEIGSPKCLTGWWFGTWLLFSISYMGCHPSHWLSLHHFSRWLLHHQPAMVYHIWNYTLW